MPNSRWHEVVVVLATTENAERLGKKACLSLSKGQRKRGKMPKIYLEDKKFQTWIQVNFEASYPGIL